MSPSRTSLLRGSGRRRGRRAVCILTAPQRALLHVLELLNGLGRGPNRRRQLGLRTTARGSGGSGTDRTIVHRAVTTGVVHELDLALVNAVVIVLLLLVGQFHGANQLVLDGGHLH